MDIQLFEFGVTSMHGSTREPRVCASAGHTFKDNTIE